MVTLTMDEPERRSVGWERVAARERLREPSSPPRTVEHDLRLAVDEAERDLGRRTPECGAERTSTVIADGDRPWRARRSFDEIATIDPGMPGGPPLSSPGRDDGRGAHAGR